MQKCTRAVAAPQRRPLRFVRGRSQDQWAALGGLHWTSVSAIAYGAHNLGPDNRERWADAGGWGVVELWAVEASPTGRSPDTTC
ncbi:MAG: hypothetical protein ACYCT3_09055 [Acidiferrobacter sp.]